MKLDTFTTEQLEEEVERRRKKEAEPPEAVANPDFREVIDTAMEGVASMVRDDYEDDDLSHLIYERVMEAVFGPGYWAWRNARGW